MAKTKIGSDVEKLVDEAITLDEEIKAKTERLTELKSELKKWARDMDRKQLLGSVGQAIVSPTTQTEADPLRLYMLMQKMELKDRYWEVVKVSVKDAREMVGTSAFETISETKTIPYAKVVLKRS